MLYKLGKSINRITQIGDESSIDVSYIGDTQCKKLRIRLDF